MNCNTKHPPNRDISFLREGFRNKVEKWLKENPEIFVTESIRSEERQQCLIENNLSWVNISNHQLGMAVDIAFHGSELYPEDIEKWNKVALSAKSFGIDWGYNLWREDKPHFQESETPLKPNKSTLLENNSKLWNKCEGAIGLMKEIQNELHNESELIRSTYEQ